MNIIANEASVLAYGNGLDVQTLIHLTGMVALLCRTIFVGRQTPASVDLGKKID